ncbi:MAG: DUF2070 family protein [Candidatus Micrarchaeota archaeon]|nr:DUF2070 family protein [Candidatus Micrarchaeota archaeon]
MPDSRSYITHYVKYFNLQAPSVNVQVIILLLLGAAAGCFAALIIQMHSINSGLLQIILLGVSSGILVVSLPAILTTAVIKILRRKMMLKHAMLSTLLITAVYAILFFVGSASYVVTRNALVSSLFLILINAGVYGYWLIMGKFLIGKLRKMALVAATQPLLNVLLYLSLGQYILSFRVPLDITLAKLVSGMVVFLLAGYALIYVIDRPSKKILEASGMNVVISMVSQWLFEISNDVNVVGQGVGVRRDLSMGILALKDAEGYKGIFVNPDVHFGPFHGVGGSVVPLSMGKILADKFHTTPFVLHAPLDIQDNPVSTSRAYSLGGLVEQSVRSMRHFSKAYGSFSLGQAGDCKSLNVKIGDTGIFLLTKAPEVTEDMSREVGTRLQSTAEYMSGGNALIVDAHNSRFETASASELDGIQIDSAYVSKYERAIRESTRKRSNKRMEFGAAHRRIARALGNPRDLGEGYTSVCVFKFGGRKLCFIYFDANNMLPGFRDKLLEHVRSRFRLEAEVCTSDTHSLNTISSSASMSLGRQTGVNSITPIVDSMIRSALGEMKPASYAYKKVRVKDFYVWGEKADMLIERTGAEVRRLLKYIAPLFVVAAFVIAAWVIYVI